MSVFVTDGNERSTLAVVRALGREGLQVTVGSTTQTSLAGSSRYCSRHVRYPSPKEQQGNFQSFLLNEMRDSPYQVLLAMTDITVQLVAQIGDSLRPWVRLPIPTGKQIEQAQDKRAVLLLAQEFGIACPETFTLRAGQSLADLPHSIRYPVVIKPRFSWWLQDAKWVSGNVEYAYNLEDLTQRYSRSQQSIPDPMVQEKIEGEGRGVFLLMWNGELKAAFCHRRLREKPPWGGVSVYRESIALDKELVNRCVRLLQAIGWQGPAMVEFKVDRRDGQAKLMEVNARFWGSLQLAIDAGINFPLMLYRLANGEDVPGQFEYKVGVKSRWLLGDLDHLLIRLTHSQRNGYSQQQPSRLRASLDFMKLYERNMYYEVFRLKDPGPGWYEWKSYLAHLLGRDAARNEGLRAH